MLPADTLTIPHVEWDEFEGQWDWRQGEHVTLIGPTGRGKTTLTTHVLPRRNYVIFLGTKRQDSTQSALVKAGYRQTADANEIHRDVASRWLLKPAYAKGANVKQIKQAQAQVFRRALMMAFRQGGWTIVADEIRYLTNYLGLQDEMEILWLQGRSLHVTIVAGTQRPRHVPLEAYSQANHLFFWQTPDGQDVARVAELASLNREAIAATVPNLEKYHVLYVNTTTGDMVTTVPPPPGG